MIYLIVILVYPGFAHTFAHISGGRDVTPPERARGTAAASRGYPKQSHLGSQRQGNGERHRKDIEVSQKEARIN